MAIQISKLSSVSEKKVSDLFVKQSMNFAGITLHYERGPEFKKLLSLQAPQYQTYIAEQDQVLRSMISISSGPRWLDGQIQDVGVVSDFRIDGTRASRLVWRELLGGVMGQYDAEFSTQKPKKYFAVILKDNRQATQSFASASRKNPFKMKEISEVEMVNIFLRHQKFESSKEYSVSFASEIEEKEILQFLKQAEQKKQMGYVFGESHYDEWLERKKKWGVKIQDFILVKLRGKIVACTLPWAPQNDVKKLYFSKAPGFLQGTLKFFSYFGMQVPLKNEAIKTLYLTHLNFASQVDSDRILQQMLNFLYKNKMQRGYQMVSFANWSKVGVNSPIFKRTFHQRIPVSVYSISIAGREFVEPDPLKIFNFEMAVV